MSVEQNNHSLNIRGGNKKDIVIDISIRDGNGRLHSLSNNQAGISNNSNEINNTQAKTNNPIPSIDGIFMGKEIPSSLLFKTSHSQVDTVIDIGYRDIDGRIVRLSNDQS